MSKKKILTSKIMSSDEEKVEYSPFSIGVSDEPNPDGEKNLPKYSIRMNDNKEVEIGKFKGIKNLALATKNVNYTHLIFDSPEPKGD